MFENVELRANSAESELRADTAVEKMLVYVMDFVKVSHSVKTSLLPCNSEQ